jgi:hypothetical protein
VKKVILRTPMRRRNNSFSDVLFKAWTVVPSVGLFSKLTTKPTKAVWTVAPSVGLFSKINETGKTKEVKVRGGKASLKK